MLSCDFCFDFTALMHNAWAKLLSQKTHTHTHTPAVSSALSHLGDQGISLSLGGVGNYNVTDIFDMLVGLFWEGMRGNPLKVSSREWAILHKICFLTKWSIWRWYLLFFWQYKLISKLSSNLAFCWKPMRNSELLKNFELAWYGMESSPFSEGSCIAEMLCPF